MWTVAVLAQMMVHIERLACTHFWGVEVYKMAHILAQVCKLAVVGTKALVCMLVLVQACMTVLVGHMMVLVGRKVRAFLLLVHKIEASLLVCMIVVAFWQVCVMPQAELASFVVF